MDFGLLAAPTRRRAEGSCGKHERFRLAGNEIGSGRKGRRRHLLAHPHLLGREADEMDEARAGPANYLKQKRREPRQRVIAAGENPNICP